MEAQRDAEPLGRHAIYHQAGHLLRQTRNPEGLQRILSGYFGIPVRIVEYVAHWVALEPDARLALGRSGENMGLGTGATLGCAVRDAQSRFRLVLGPMGWADYRRFLPGGDRVPALLHWLREYVGLELAWDAQLILAADQVRGTALGEPRPLGLGTWLGRRPADAGDAGDLIIDYSHLGESHV
ncbi:type VI secretion system baseplate subunit TssG [Azotobacter vinelandii]